MQTYKPALIQYSGPAPALQLSTKKGLLQYSLYKYLPIQVVCCETALLHIHTSLFSNELYMRCLHCCMCMCMCMCMCIVVTRLRTYKQRTECCG